jgi:outer membrane protein OmpA-like peptidoglycan-associated protein
MKKLFLLASAIVIVSAANAQFLKKVLDKTKQKTEDKVSEKISNKVSDAASNPIDNVGKSNKNKDNSVANTNGKPSQQNGSDVKSDVGSGPATLATYSKYDFVPGEKILVVEDFAQDAIGDFPDKWNTNGSGEVVTVEGQQGHWLMVKKKGRFIPEYMNSLPDNFTFQFDLVCNENFNYYSNALQLFFVSGGNGKNALDYSFIQNDKRSGIKLGFHPTNGTGKGGTCYINTFEDGEIAINNQVPTVQFNSLNDKKKVKVSVWRQKQRVRVYLNEEKVMDLPRAFAAGKTYNTVMFELWGDMNNDVDRYLINNITLAVGAPDTRNKLISEGKFVTHGILFDVNSDKIKPESYGTLKDIATVLTENPDVKVKIVGHTDSDGKDADNLTLSKRRAESVKNTLMNEFQIDASRMETDGKGASQPVDKNDTPQGKANNRRVEFIKL